MEGAVFAPGTHLSNLLKRQRTVAKRSCVVERERNQTWLTAPRTAELKWTIPRFLNMAHHVAKLGIEVAEESWKCGSKGMSGQCQIGRRVQGLWLQNFD